MATATTKTPAKKATAKKTAAKKTAAKKTTPLREREPQVLAEDTSYAVAGLAVDAVSLAKAAVAKIDELRAEVAKVTADPKATVASVRTAAEKAPATAKETAEDVRGKLVKELESAIASFEKTFDAKAVEGRKLIDALKKDQRVNRFLDQTASTRAQIKAAVTSLTRTAETAVEAGKKQADVATAQLKGAVTSVRKSATAASDAAEAVQAEVDQAS